jgi:hypothetical protein
MNLYGFAGGDPVSFSDPVGLCPPKDKPCHDQTAAEGKALVGRAQAMKVTIR